MVFTWYRELGLAIEKHRTTTSDLKGTRRTNSLKSESTKQVLEDNVAFYNVSPAVCKTSVLMMVSKCIPETKGHTDVIHHISGAL